MIGKLKAVAGVGLVGAGYMGLSEAGSFLSDPRDYIRSRGSQMVATHEAVGTTGLAAAIGSGGALLGSAVAIGGAGYMGHKISSPIASGVSNLTSKTIDKAVNSVGQSWDRYGAASTLGSFAKMGMLYGGLTTTMSLSLNRYVSEDAMAQSQQGGIYEGNDGFGNRNESTVKTMGSSTMGLTQGLHNRR